MNANKIKKTHPSVPSDDLIKKAVRIIKSGGIIVFPTRCLYGLGADAFNLKAVNRIFSIKQRPSNKPVSVLIKNKEALNKLVKNVPPVASWIIDCFWPGRITIVFEAKDTVPDNITAGTGKIGLRIPEHPVACSLLNDLDVPVTATSANISNCAGCSRILDLDSLIADRLDLILDAGPLKAGPGSTVIDVTEELPVILREGEVSEKDILTCLFNRLK